MSGRLQVTWQLLRLENDFSMTMSMTVLGKHAWTIDVLDQVGEQVFIVDLDGDALTDLTN